MQIKVEKLNFSIGKKQILNDVSVSVNEPCLLSIVGPNGAGKSTLLKLMAGILKPDSGSINICNTNSIFESVSYIPQALPVMKGYSGWDLLDCFQYSFKKVGKRSEEMKECLELFSVSEYMERDITTLSGGELQRLYLACAVSPGPKVLLLDEALSAMDPHIQEDVIQKIVQFQKQKEITIIHVSHQINNAIHISDKVLALKDGENFYSGDCKEFNQAKIDKLFDYKFNYTEHPQSGRPVILPGSGQ